MAQQIINIGTSPNDGTGDPLRTAMTKVVNNFAEVYSGLSFTLASNNATAVNNFTVAANTTSNNLIVTSNGTINNLSVSATLSVSANVSVGANVTLNTSVVAVSNSVGNVRFNAISLVVANSTANVVVANTAGLTLSNTGLTLGSALKQANNGYVYLPNGLLMQWGQVPANTTATDVTFAVPYTTNAYGISLTAANSTAATNGSIAYINGVNSTVISIRSANATTGGLVNWTAIGS